MEARMSLIKSSIRSGAFVSKEINEVRRQPRLILSLILGPFLILFLFGIGYKGEETTLSGIFVLPKQGGYSTNIADYQKLVGGQLQIKSVTTNLQSALDELNRHNVERVVVVPSDISQTISSGAQVKVPIYFNEVDPLRRDLIIYLTYVYANEINKQTLTEAAHQSQVNASDVRATLLRIRNSLAAVEQRLAAGDITGASQQSKELPGSITNVQLGLVILSQLLASDSTLVKQPQPQDPNQVNLTQGGNIAQKLSTDMQALTDELNKPSPDPEVARQGIASIREDVDTFDKLTQQFQSINPLVLAAPFTAEAKNTASITPNFTAFYAPGMLVLILQHMAITLAALSMVRERMLGTVELFRVAPIRASEILTGKHISFMALLGVVAGALLLMMSNEFTIGGVHLSLRVPILGDWVYLVLSLVLVVFASVGLGFLIAAISKSESQAVQLSMLVLLASVFFSGFFLRVETIWEPIQAVSYALPVTYGIADLQVIMLRGGTPQPVLLIGLAGLGVLFTLVSYVLLKRELTRG
jgi:ABC-2 type transport system permease protein